jgi:hypothetical protein
MDLELYARVVWRHKVITGLGLLAAIALAFLSFVRVGTDGIAYRDVEQWVSYETVSVTQPGFTEGRLNYQGADPSRLTLLAVLYSNYMDADAVHKQIWPRAVPHESVEAAPVLSSPGGSAASPLPIISIAAFAPTPRDAQRLASRSTAALIAYIAQRQETGRVPVEQRVLLEPVKRAQTNRPALWQGRSKSLPIVVFLTAAIAAIGLAFILENLNPQISAVAARAVEEEDRVGRRPRAS